MKLNLTLFRNELFPVYFTDRANQVVNARELHAILGIDELFAAWVRRKIKSHGLLEDKQYTTYFEKSKKGRPTKEYIFLLDSAKKVAMGTNNAQGDKVKDYFLECERIAKELIQKPTPNPTPTPILDLGSHTERNIQVNNSKEIAKVKFKEGGKDAAIKHYQDVMVMVVGRTPGEIKKIAKEDGFPSRFYNNAREVLRAALPAHACTISLLDTLVKGGSDFSKLKPIADEAKSLFEKILDLGHKPKELYQ